MCTTRESLRASFIGDRRPDTACHQRTVRQEGVSRWRLTTSRAAERTFPTTLAAAKASKGLIMATASAFFNRTMHLHLSPDLAATLERDAEDVILIALFFWALYLMLVGCRDHERTDRVRGVLRSSAKWLQESFEHSRLTTTKVVRRASHLFLGQPAMEDDRAEVQPTRRAMV